jgi:hypothetical protein
MLFLETGMAGWGSSLIQNGLRVQFPGIREIFRDSLLATDPRKSESIGKCDLFDVPLSN